MTGPHHKLEFYGTATVGEKGQIVIPAEARAALGLKTGDKLLVAGHRHGKKLVVVKPEDIKEFVAGLSAHLEGLKKSLRRTLKQSGEDS